MTIVVGIVDGASLGMLLGALVGVLVGIVDGASLGMLLGVLVGVLVGIADGASLGMLLGVLVGALVGVLVDALLGTVGSSRGEKENGTRVGGGEGSEPPTTLYIAEAASSHTAASTFAARLGLVTAGGMPNWHSG